MTSVQPDFFIKKWGGQKGQNFSQIIQYSERKRHSGEDLITDSKGYIINFRFDPQIHF